MNLEKVGFDPGHYEGQNIGPNGYIEGNAMLKLGKMLQEKYGSFLTRTDGKDVSFSERAKRAAHCNTLVSIHTNAPEAAKGVIVFYSLERPGDKVLAESIGKELAKAMGIQFRCAATRKSTHTVNGKEVDYYAMIRRPILAGIEHVFIVEHGSHWEMAIDTEKKLQAIVECYGRIFNLSDRYTVALQKISSKVGIDVPYWQARKDIDPYFDDLIIKIAGVM